MKGTKKWLLIGLFALVALLIFIFPAIELRMLQKKAWEEFTKIHLPKTDRWVTYVFVAEPWTTYLKICSLLVFVSFMVSASSFSYAWWLYIKNRRKWTIEMGLFALVVMIVSILAVIELGILQILDIRTNIMGFSVGFDIFGMPAPLTICIFICLSLASISFIVATCSFAYSGWLAIKDRNRTVKKNEFSNLR